MKNKKNPKVLIKENLPYLKKEFGISKVGLFGSIAKGTETESSDIDVVVELNKPLGFKFIELVDFFETLFGRKVDVLTKDGIENIRIRGIAEDIKRTIVYV